jgi:hypothetical protein
MVRTSTAEQNGYRCPACADELKHDNSGRGYVSHVSNRDCQYEKGQRDGDGAIGVSVRVSRPLFPDHEPSPGVRISGYSERGIFNALLYEIGFSTDPMAVLGALLALVCFPGRGADFSDLGGAEILIEQSLSDFGDADAILLLHGANWRRVIFVEGKVKPSQTGHWTMHGAWSKFLARDGGKMHSSNLFTQLYHKVRFIAALRTGGLHALQAGVEFPACSTNSSRKIGHNPVVLRAARMIEGYSEQALYVAIVPDTTERLEDFFANELNEGPADDVTGWDIDGWGYLSWERVESFCRDHDLTNTLRVFDFNRGQIF